MGGVKVGLLNWAPPIKPLKRVSIGGVNKL